MSASPGYLMGRLKQLEINQAGRHALARVVSNYRTSNCRDLDDMERQDLADLLAEVETELSGGAF